VSEVSQGRIFGYARVSSTEENLDGQLAESVKYVPGENIVIDKQSGEDLEKGGYLALKGRFGFCRCVILWFLCRRRYNIRAMC